MRVISRAFRTVAALAVIIATSTSPASSAAPADHVYDLAQTWSCRTVDGAIQRQTGRRSDDGVIVRTDTLSGKASPASYDTRYAFDTAGARWRVSVAPKTVAAFSAAASPWTGPMWTVEGTDVNAVPRRMTFEWLADGDYRLTVASLNGPGWYPDSAERCTPGSTPPAPGSCIVETYPAATLVPVVTSSRFVPRNVHGLVVVIISLDEQSRLTNARIQSSPSALLNPAALADARASTYRTAIRDCKPVAADYVFTVTF